MGKKTDAIWEVFHAGREIWVVIDDLRELAHHFDRGCLVRLVKGI